MEELWAELFYCPNFLHVAFLFLAELIASRWTVALQVACRTGKNKKMAVWSTQCSWTPSISVFCCSHTLALFCLRIWGLGTLTRLH